MRQKGRERETLGKYPNNYNHAAIIRSMSEPPSCTDHSNIEGVVVVKMNINHERLVVAMVTEAEVVVWDVGGGPV